MSTVQSLLPSNSLCSRQRKTTDSQSIAAIDMTRRILVVDDDHLTRRSLELHLTQAGYAVDTAARIGDALTLAQSKVPDLLLLDIGLPDVDGLEGLRLFHSQQPTLPVIFLTARRRELDQIVGLELGADDYITKPFDVDVLLAHIKAVLRRTSDSAGTVVPSSPLIKVGDISIDPAGRVVMRADEVIELTPKEFGVLLYLARSPGLVRTAHEILQNVWGENWIGEEQTIYVHIRWLRTKLEDDPGNPTRVITVRGAGYKLVADTQKTKT